MLSCAPQVKGTGPALDRLIFTRELLYPPSYCKFWGAEKHLADQEGFVSNIVSHGDLCTLRPVKRIYSFTKLCTAMKSYDCAILRLEQAYAAMCRPSVPCSHPSRMFYPTVEYVLMSFSEPKSLLVNMPTFQFCTHCGQCLGQARRDYVSPEAELSHTVGYSDTIV